MKKCSKCGYPSLEDNSKECTCGAFFKEEIKEPKILWALILFVVSGVEVILLDFLLSSYFGKFEKTVVWLLFAFFYIGQFLIILYLEKKRINSYIKRGKIEAKAIFNDEVYKRPNLNRGNIYTPTRRKRNDGNNTTDDSFLTGVAVGTVITSSIDSCGGSDSGGGCGGD